LKFVKDDNINRLIWAFNTNWAVLNIHYISKTPSASVLRYELP